MADQRYFSRFRLPWLSAATAPQPQPQPQLQQQTTRPIEIVAPAQPQRPPFRPAGIAQVVQPTQPPARTEPRPPPPARGATGPQAGSLPTSPARDTTRTGAGSVPPSPARGATQPRSTSVPQSPTRPTSQPQPSQATQFPPSPSVQGPKPAVSLQEAAEKVKEMERKRDAEKQKAKEPTSQDKKTVATGPGHPKPRNKFTESHQKPGVSNGEQKPLQKEIKDDITKLVHKLATGELKHPMDNKPVSIVTIAGDNKGAAMHVSSEPVKKEGSVHIYRGYKVNPDESFGTTTDAEDSVKGEKPKDPTEEPEEMAFINSNIQSINNSMLLESSVNEGSPGVHLVLSQSLAEPIKQEEPLETLKAEFSVTSAQKLYL